MPSSLRSCEEACEMHVKACHQQNIDSERLRFNDFWYLDSCTAVYCACTESLLLGLCLVLQFFDDVSGFMSSRQWVR